MACAVELTVAAHDTTGGMKTKISEAAMIAKLGIDVYIVKVIFMLCFICLSYFLELLMLKLVAEFAGSNKPLIEGIKWRSEKWHPR